MISFFIFFFLLVETLRTSLVNFGDVTSFSPSHNASFSHFLFAMGYSERR
jgi:hypothetical protein